MSQAKTSEASSLNIWTELGQKKKNGNFPIFNKQSFSFKKIERAYRIYVQTIKII